MTDEYLEKRVITEGSLSLGTGERTALAKITDPTSINFFYSGYLRGHRKAVRLFIRDEDEFFHLASLDDIERQVQSSRQDELTFNVGMAIGYLSGLINGAIICPEHYIYRRMHPKR